MKACILALALLCCLAHAGDRPDFIASPGAINPAVTQANIHSTICVSGWTKTIRPPASYTNALKRKQLASGIYASNMLPRDAEEDHIVSLELGGAPREPLNLWPEPYAGKYGAHQKDRLENALKKAVCAGQITLHDAQEAIRTDWIAAYRKRFGAAK